MNIEDYRAYCLALSPFVEEKFPFRAFRSASDVLVFYIRKHMFAFLDCNDFRVVTLKCQPERIADLKERCPYIGNPYNESAKYWIGVDVTQAPDRVVKLLTLNSFLIVRDKYAKR